MTRRWFYISMAAISCYFAVVIAVALLSKNGVLPIEIYNFIRELSSLLTALPIPILVNILQRRVDFVKSLRELWTAMNKAKSGLLKYTYFRNPTLDQYLDAYQGLSVVIDDLRAVYRNVGVTGKERGFYPFKPLHDMRRAFEKLNPSARIDATTVVPTGHETRHEILRAWDVMRERFLSEFRPPEPTNPVTDLASTPKTGPRAG